ncbi:CRISPR-associated endonuclease Cas2 [candidate division KSB1 bacterium]|nr:CRISPR-associated endonuclease Cas2 [candidate division KSB1 bacterium]
MFCIISYDITDDKIRTKLAHRLKDFGKRVQFSVFEADLKPKELTKLTGVLDKVKLEGEDSIRVYQICQSCLERIKIWGIGEITQDKPYYLG